MPYTAGSPGAGQWSWATGTAPTGRVILGADPTGTTITYTPNGGSQQVCVSLLDSCDNIITGGGWQNLTVELDLSQAPNSGEDFTANGGAQGFAAVTTPASFTAPNLIKVKGNLVSGKACVTLSATSLPTDTPTSPIKVTPTYFGAPALTHSVGNDTAAFVLIRSGGGVVSGTDEFHRHLACNQQRFRPRPVGAVRTRPSHRNRAALES